MNKIEKDKIRFNELIVFDKSFEVNILCGIDEAGRGAWAGPIVAACVILPPNFDLYEINDSKKIKEENRYILAERIKEKALAYGIGIVDACKIDEIGTQKANFLAFELAYNNMINNYKIIPNLILIDGNFKGISLPNYKSITKGDSLSASISSASLIAKAERDKIMIEEFHSQYPQYCFDKHKGYGTKIHQEAILKHGLLNIHRRSFCKKFLIKNGLERSDIIATKS